MKKLLVRCWVFVVFLLLTAHSLFPTIYAVEPSPTISNPEQQAVFNMSWGVLPQELAQKQQPPEQNIFQQFFNSAGYLISGLFNSLFYGKITDPPKIYVQSDNLDQSTVPQELLPTGEDVIGNIQKYLGGNVGIYGVDLPSEIQRQVNPTAGAPIGQAEKAYEQANFPEGINPITESNKAK